MTTSPLQRLGCLLLCVALLASTIAGCDSAPPTPRPPAKPTKAQPPEPVAYVANQIVVTGPKSDVEWAVETVRQKLSLDSLQLLDRIDLAGDALRRALGSEQAGAPASEKGEFRTCPGLSDLNATLAGCVSDLDEGWTWQLYGYGGAPSVEQVVEAFAAADRPCVFPDANYVTGLPWSGEGSPWSGEGSPWSGEGSPWTPPSGTGSIDDFKTQWAFQQIGLVDSAGARPIKPTGAGVQVAVLDTSPLTETQTLLPWLSVVDDWLPASTGVVTASHGLFVAGLIHEVAPDARITLYRVLDDQAKGDVFKLDQALFDLVSSAADQPGVINLSLGIRAPSDQYTGPLPREIVALQLMLGYAGCKNLVPVAAAGNRRLPGQPPPAPQLPASYDWVLDVAATNFERVPACFSNKGLVGAPGGDGAMGCVPCTTDCEKLNLIGPVLASGSLVYAYWAGTSFATPLVSGHAALLLESRPAVDAVDAILTTTGSLTDTDNVVDKGIIDLGRLP